MPTVISTKKTIGNKIKINTIRCVFRHVEIMVLLCGFLSLNGRHPKKVFVYTIFVSNNLKRKKLDGLNWQPRRLELYHIATNNFPPKNF